MNCPDYRHPLVHNGTSQLDRQRRALFPESVRLDNRTVADVFQFTHHLAGLFKYFDKNNQEAGNWQPFFEKEVVGILAIIVATDLSAYDIAYVEDEVKFWEEGPAKEEENYRLLLQHIYELAVKIQQLCQRIPDSLGLKAEILSIIQNQIGQAIFDNRVQNVLEQLIAYDKGSGALPGPDKYKQFIIGENGPTDCTRAWGLYKEDSPDAWQDSYFCILADDGFREQQPPELCKENRKLRALFIIFFQALAMIVDRARVYLRSELLRNRAQKPHLSLFLTFIFIFKYLQRQYNQLPQRHLDYYFAEVLRLRPQSFQPDQAHAIFELAKNFDDFTLEPGTLLEAIKDKNGNPLRYFVNDELVLNQAKVEALKTSYLEANDTSYRMLALPMADSKNGRGMPFESEANTRWRPFGDVKQERTNEDFGFAISSPEFTLREGERYIILSLTFKNEIEEGLLPDSIKHVEYSSNEEDAEWKILARQDVADLPLSLMNFDSREFNSPDSPIPSGFSLDRISPKVLRVGILIKSDLPPVEIPVSPQSSLSKALAYPTFKFILKRNGLVKYSLLKDIEIQNIHIKVGVRGVRDLILQNSDGVHVNQGPIPAFGRMLAATGVNARPLYIGSDEVLRKKIAFVNDGNSKLGLELFFETPPSPGVTSLNLNSAKANFLVDGVFSEARNFNKNDTIEQREVPFPEIEIGETKIIKKFEIEDGADIPILRTPHEELEPLDFKALNGFIKFSLNYTLVKDESANPNQLFPNFQNFFLNYTAERDESFSQKEQYFHILPFGFKELENSISEEIAEAERRPIAIIPPFDPPQVNSEIRENLIANGNLFIGIKDLVPGQSLSLLFQVLAGSGDPAYEPPVINWSYLAQEGSNFFWQEFSPENIVSDTTRVDLASEKSLLRSGIVQFNTSSNMTDRGTLVDPDKKLHWIRASAVEKPEERERVRALPDLVAVHAQAVLCTFINNGNSLTHLESAMPKESISKLTERKTAVKKVEQPFASFEGKNVEVPNEFYKRVSERLRHKNRATNIWDYEHLLLQQFPQIRHAKCISHSRPGCEIDPGYVTIAVFPDLRNRNGFNRTAPGLGTGELKAMQQFLRERGNLFLYCDNKIQVVNPVYELLKVTACIKFQEGFLPKKYAKILNDDIKRFLAPWAFDDDAPIFFSNIFNSSTILNFIEERPYVDKVFDFGVSRASNDPEAPMKPLGLKAAKTFSQRVQAVQANNNLFERVEREAILATSARSVFTTTSAAENIPTSEADHEILIWGEEGCESCLQPEEFTQFETCSEV